ncbi:hypothetical protein AMATHDRAFT_49059 [Amanita thiersii Skay4041]|uniref:Uncharacterized protein n=1 Tax=Amanita thiersii Skay4041 TaxID=703135 RepID=A0A2A9NEI6_9AGAR|nr:hypothetical protein AMATHDRAFT_49059 [Amanita thiersii Skay4041]
MTLPADIVGIGESNRSYSDVQIHEITQLAAGVKDQLHLVDKKIASLHTKRDVLSKQLYGCKAALAPHKRLPANILKDIFRLSVEDMPIICLPKERSRDMRIQICLSHVCTRWRRIMLTAPSLWTNLKVSDFLFRRRRLDAAREFLSRSKRCPVSLSVSQSFHKRDGVPLEIKLATLMDLLQRQLLAPHRILEFSLKITMWDYDQDDAFFAMGKVREFLRTSHPDLEILHFDISVTLKRGVKVDLNPSLQSTNGPGGSMAKGLPSLKTLHLDSSALFLASIRDYMCWEQLRDLTIRAIPIEWALAILHQCRLLETFTVDELHPHNYEPFKPALQIKDLHISLPYFRRLKLSISNCSTNRHLSSFLAPLDMPNLTSLYYHVLYPTPTEIWPRQADPLIEARLQLDKLRELELHSLNPFCRASPWRKARNLRRLHLHRSELTSDYASNLASGHSFPLLQDIHLEYHLTRGLALVPIFQMLEGRQKRAAACMMQQEGTTEGDDRDLVLPFKRVKFSCDEMEFEPFKDRAEVLRNDGLELDIRLLKSLF